MKKSFQILVFFIVILCFACQQKSTETHYRIETTYGNIELRLYEETPLHSNNFSKLVSQDFYDGILFHRVIPGFMIQGGDPYSGHAKTGELLGDSTIGYTIPAEFKPGIYHKRGVIAAAREGDDVNPDRASDGAQFYLVEGKIWERDSLLAYAKKRDFKLNKKQIELYTTVGGTPHLDGNYTVFGEITSGYEVVEKISRASRDSNDRPHKDIKMTIKAITNAD